MPSASRQRAGLLVLALLVAVGAALTVSAGLAAAAARDRDRDGLPDRWERRFQLSTKARSASQDSDHDRLRNRSEYRRKLNPRRADSDRDGLSDGYEVFRSKTNPRRADTDGDGYTDGVEVRAGSNPRNRASVPAATGTQTAPGHDGGPPSPAASLIAQAPGRPAPPSLPRPTRADGQVANAAELVARAKSPASAGKVFWVRAGNYGSLNLAEARPPGLVWFVAYPGETPMFGHTQFKNSHNIRIEGVRFSGGATLLPPDPAIRNRNIHLVGNEFTSTSPTDAVKVREYSDDVLIESNEIHHLATGGGDLGYGITVHGSYGPCVNVTIRGNSIHHLPNDAIQTSGAQNLLIDNNEISQIDMQPGSSAHADPIQVMWAYPNSLVIRNNRLHDNSQAVLIQDGIEGGLIENNLIHTTQNYGIQAGHTGPGPWRGIRGFTFRRNTIWDTGLAWGGGHGLLIRGTGSGNTLEANILHALEGDNPAGQFSLARSNAIAGGQRLGYTGPVPLFRDRLAFEPVNLPFLAGYRRP